MVKTGTPSTRLALVLYRGGEGRYRATHLEERTSMIQTWADYLDKLAKGAGVCRHGDGQYANHLPF